jgi:hypothetical protein
MSGLRLPSLRRWSPPCLAVGVLVAMSLFADLKVVSHNGLLLIGPASFIEETQGALDLLAERDPEAYVFVRQTLAVVVQARTSRVYPFPNVTTVSERVRKSGPEWYASSLAHEAYHIYLYHQSAATATPWQGSEAERVSLSFQYTVASRLGAKDATLRHLDDALALRYWEVMPSEQSW